MTRWLLLLVAAACDEPQLSHEVDLAVADLLAPDLLTPRGAALPTGPTRYPHDALASPLTPSVAESLRAIAARGAHEADVFMKVGGSGTVNPNLLFCFAGLPEYTLDLDGRSTLQPTIDFFRGGDAAGTTPFDRPTLAASVGKSAIWAITGNPSPLESEMAAIDPRFAFVNYGTNDMELGKTYESALFPFYDNFSQLLDQLEAAGIVPLLTGLNPRADKADAAAWVPTYDAVTRAVAEARQIPYFSLYLASSPLKDLGLNPDGLHGNVYYVANAPQPCVFTAAGLEFNYDVRNLYSLQALDAARRVVNDSQPAPDADVLPPISGDGSDAAPFVVDRLPFSHAFDTTSGARVRDRYPACGNENESGPEIVYDLELDRPARILAFDRGAVDVDLHLLDAAGSCVSRDDRMIEATAGHYRLVVDSFVSGSTVHSGAYLLVIVPL